MAVKIGKIEPDGIVPIKLSAIVLDIEKLLQPFQHSLNTEIETANGTPTTIRLTVEIHQRSLA